MTGENTLGLRGVIGAGGLIVNDWELRVDRTEEGARITLSRGGSVQSADIKDGTSLVWRGAYSASRTYLTGDVTSLGDGLYVALAANMGESPASSAKWARCLSVSALREQVTSFLAEGRRSMEAIALAETQRQAAESERQEAERRREAADRERQGFGICLRDGLIMMEVDQ